MLIYFEPKYLLSEEHLISFFFLTVKTFCLGQVIIHTKLFLRPLFDKSLSSLDMNDIFFFFFFLFLEFSSVSSKCCVPNLVSLHQTIWL